MQDFRLAGQGQYVHHWQVCISTTPENVCSSR